MAKDKEKKKKERERRVAQKKIAAAQKRAHEKTASEPQHSFSKTNTLSAGLARAKVDQRSAATTKKPFNYRRSGG